jgi:hypothetical protein
MSTQQFGISNLNAKPIGSQLRQVMRLAMVAASRTQGGNITSAEIIVPVQAPSIVSLSPAPRGLYQELVWNVFMVLVGKSLKTVFLRAIGFGWSISTVVATMYGKLLLCI